MSDDPLPECSRCGGRGQHVKMIPPLPGAPVFYECVDRKACDARVERCRDRHA